MTPKFNGRLKDRWRKSKSSKTHTVPPDTPTCQNLSGLLLGINKSRYKLKSLSLSVFKNFSCRVTNYLDRGMYVYFCGRNLSHLKKIFFFKSKNAIFIKFCYSYNAPNIS